MIDYLLIGHGSTDLTPDGPKPGGAVTFASRVAQVLGCRTAVLTSAAPDYDLNQAFPDGVDVVCLPAEQTTTFENVYSSDGSRRQTIHGVARTLRGSDVPKEWRNAKIVHIAPIAEEVDPAVAHVFPDSAIGLTPQGWMRGWDIRGNVFAEPAPHVGAILPLVSAIVVSEEDLISHDQVQAALRVTPLIAVTNGSKGCTVYHIGEVRSFTPPQVEAVDATGAGDTFATAFFIRLHQSGGEVWEAARFANYIAARSVTQPDPASKMQEIHRAIEEYS